MVSHLRRQIDPCGRTAKKVVQPQTSIALADITDDGMGVKKMNRRQYQRHYGTNDVHDESERGECHILESCGDLPPVVSKDVDETFENSQPRNQMRPTRSPRRNQASRGIQVHTSSSIWSETMIAESLNKVQKEKLET